MQVYRKRFDAATPLAAAILAGHLAWLSGDAEQSPGIGRGCGGQLLWVDSSQLGQTRDRVHDFGRFVASLLAPERMGDQIRTVGLG